MLVEKKCQYSITASTISQNIMKSKVGALLYSSRAFQWYTKSATRGAMAGEIWELNSLSLVQYNLFRFMGVGDGGETKQCTLYV